MACLMAQYRVRDRSEFRRIFDGFDDVRREHGSTGNRVLHAAGDDEVVVVLIEFPDADRAAAFASDARRLDALGRATVVERSDLVLLDD